MTDELRCCCGNLLARWLERELELKCRRCKRVIRLPYPEKQQPERVNIEPTQTR
ncbi:MAG: hypothetical protein H6707_02615 [Deltaproteobacteria bacterium]|nr:hypothetical protein [Deltaproteobacteria bacterium]